MSETFDLAELTDFVSTLFVRAGLETDKSAAVACYLIEADLMGHTTHGLALAPWYLQSVRDGVMKTGGTYEILSDRGAAQCWDGKRLPGAWLTSEAMKIAVNRARTFGSATIAIGNSHHIGALSAYLSIATDQSMLASVASSSPSGAQVAPFGGLDGVFTPNPVAWGIPTNAQPLLIDISASITTVNMATRLKREGRVYDHDWLMDRDGRIGNDPEILDDGATLLPTGGVDHGQKGYGMALSVEALTQGLAGYGRANAPKGTNAAVTVSVYDPAAFGGVENFVTQTGWLRDACLASRPKDPSHPVRLPGQAALLRKAASIRDGVRLYPGIADSLNAEAQRYGIATISAQA
ncbi:Ldh family oxidoreductase [Thalassospira sp.]|uniref:Ldh family oxidoreductase n=1 Tax=Thalassospira sp. TaxID=1912094 RepID=UPI00273384C6|nr:Ldh family oxidoreductase [Thalassospira sp.]MDP2699802.1 Ldh family oxidoreductase [Thalassospira sp.]